MKTKLEIMWIKMKEKISAGKEIIDNNRGASVVEIAVGIIIAVVLGILLLGGLVALFNNVILPGITIKINELFNFTP